MIYPFNNGYLSSTSLGTPLTQLLEFDFIEPGTAPSYQICKTIYEAHPIGKKMVDAPINMAMSQSREAVVDGAPERVRDAFLNMWQEMQCNAYVANHMRIARIYGQGTLVLIVDGEEPGVQLDLAKIQSKRIGFNVLDPLNTAAGTNTWNQDPNELGFQLIGTTRVAGKLYHPSRACIVMNESPLYISYSTSTFGYSGRSVYQRGLYPLKSFVQGMRTDDLITRKAGVIIAKIKQVGSMVDGVMRNVLGMQRTITKEATTDDVMSIGSEDFIESMDLKNLEGPYALARKHVLENLALSADMPAKILNSETFAEGFGEGTEDAKNIARYIDSVRETMEPIYRFMNPIVQYRAWTPEFFATIQKEFPDQYGSMDYTTAFYEWRNKFSANWPNLLTEPDSEKIKVEDIRIKGIIAVVQVFLPMMDPENKGLMLQWVQDNINEMKLLFPAPVTFDIETFVEYEPVQPGQTGEDGATEPEESKPFSASDSAASTLVDLSDAVARLSNRDKVRKPN